MAGVLLYKSLWRQKSASLGKYYFLSSSKEHSIAALMLCGI